MRVATIDIGTNTTLLLVADVENKSVRVIEDRAEITRLGRGIGADRQLHRDRVDATLAVLGEYAALARRHGAEIAAVGTEALRGAPNADELLGPAARLLGVPVEVIDGEREAMLTFRAAASAFPDAAVGTVLVVDIGGGSTEIIRAVAGQVQYRESLPLGSVRLTERHLHHDPPRHDEMQAMASEIQTILSRAQLNRQVSPPRPTLIGTAGTVTTLAAMAQGLQTYDPGRVHGFSLAVPALEAQVERLRRATVREREQMPGLDPRRADVIVAGACVLLDICRLAGVGAVTVNDRGVRWGLLYERVFGTLIARGA